MKIIITEIPCNHNYDLPPRWWREANALKATSVDAERFPILAAHWPLALIVGGKLACNDDSPLASRFKTVSIIQLREPG